MTKYILTFLVSSLLLASCTAPSVSKPQKETEVAAKVSKDFESFSAVEFTASLNVLDTATGADTPTEEAGAKMKSITKVTVSVFDEKIKLINTYVMTKLDPATKGEIARYSGGIRPVPQGKYKVRFAFTNDQGTVLFDKEAENDFKAKTIYKITGDVSQISIQRNPASTESIGINLEELKEGSYVKDQMLVGLKEDDRNIKESDLKNILQGSGIKVVELRKSFSFYTVTFADITLAEAMLFASKTERFSYIEANGIVKII